MNSREVGISNVMLPEPSSSGTYFNFKIGNVDYRHLNLPEKNVLHYVSSYLYSKCLTQHTCDLCVDYGRYQTNLDQAFLLFLLKHIPVLHRQLMVNFKCPIMIFINLYLN